MKQSLDASSALEWKQESLIACGISLQSDYKHQVCVVIMFVAWLFEGVRRETDTSIPFCAANMRSVTMTTTYTTGI